MKVWRFITLVGPYGFAAIGRCPKDPSRSRLSSSAQQRLTIKPGASGLGFYDMRRNITPANA